MDITIQRTTSDETERLRRVRAIGTLFDEPGELTYYTDTWYKHSLSTITSVNRGETEMGVLIAASRDADEDWAKTVYRVKSADDDLDSNEVELTFEDSSTETYENARLVGAAEDPHEIPGIEYVI